MSNEAGKILLAILHGKPIPPSFSSSSNSVSSAPQRRHRTPFSGFRDSFGGPSTRGHLFNAAPTHNHSHYHHHHSSSGSGIGSSNHPLPYFRVPNNPSDQSLHFQASNNNHHLNAIHSCGHPAPQRTLGMDINSYRPIRRYTREVMLSYADSDSSRRLPRRLELAFEMYPAIRRKRFGDLMNPYYYDPASAYSLGPTQLWDSELQQWVVMGHK